MNNIISKNIYVHAPNILFVLYFISDIIDLIFSVWNLFENNHYFSNFFFCHVEFTRFNIYAQGASKCPESAHKIKNSVKHA